MNEATGLIARWVDEFEAAESWDWPENPQGSAVAFLAHDLSEHLATIGWALDTGRWAVVKEIERLYFERWQVLVGVVSDARYAEAYHEPLFNYPPSPLDTFDAKAIQKEARSEDALSKYAAAFNIPSKSVEEEVKAHKYLRSTSSYYFLHPSAMGPVWSKKIGAQNREDQVEQWSIPLRISALAGIRLVWAASRFSTPVADSMINTLNATIEFAAAKAWSNFAELSNVMTDITSRIPYR